MLFSVAGHCHGLHWLSLPRQLQIEKEMVRPSVQWLLRFKAFSLQSPGISNRESESNLDMESNVPSSPSHSRCRFCPVCLSPGELFLNVVKFIVAHFSKKEWQNLTKAKSPGRRRVHRSTVDNSANKGKVSAALRVLALAHALRMHPGCYSPVK